MVFGVLLIYLIVSVVVVGAVVGWAAKRGKSTGKYAVIAAIFMYSLIFWDLIPVYTIFHYQCNANAGFTTNKTLEQWKHENPGVAETLVPFNEKSTIEGDITRYQLNQRFAWEMTRRQVWHTLYKKDEKIIDTKTGEVFAENIDFYTNLKNLVVSSNSSFGDSKFWMKIDSCESLGKRKNQINFNGYFSRTKKLGVKSNEY